MSVCVIYRIDLAKPDQPNQIELGRKDESKVHKLFLDPTGEKVCFVCSLKSHKNKYSIFRCKITAREKNNCYDDYTYLQFVLCHILKHHIVRNFAFLIFKENNF